jgi:hypothetical protein
MANEPGQLLGDDGQELNDSGVPTPGHYRFVPLQSAWPLLCEND